MPTARSADGWAALFWRAFEGSANPMVLFDADRKIVAVNDANLRTFGYERSDLIGHPADRFVAPSWLKVLEADWTQILRDGTVYAANREVIRKDRRHVRVQFAAHRERVTGRQLILWVVLEAQLKPLTHERDADQPPAPLTARELEVITWIAMGRRVHEVADELVISPATVQTHVRNAMAKVGARSQAQLVAIALSTGLLDPELMNPQM